MKLPAEVHRSPGNCLSGYILQAGGGLIGKPRVTLGHTGESSRRGPKERDKHLSIKVAPKESQPSPL